MALVIEMQPIPLAVNSNGVVRVGDTRVTLDTVIEAFLEGSTAEEIAHQYPSLNLPDIYAVIAYYLKNQYEVEKYLEARRKQAKVVREQNESKYGVGNVRERLMKRKSKA